MLCPSLSEHKQIKAASEPRIVPVSIHFNPNVELAFRGGPVRRLRT